MKQTYVVLPDSFYKGLICKVHVSKEGKQSCKELKVCTVKTRTITFMEVDKVNRKNIFRKVNRTDIVKFSPTAICELTIRDGILPDRWESFWDSIGQPSPSVQSYGRFATASKGLASQASKHFPVVIQRPKGSSIDALAANPPWKKSTTNSAAGFPMV
jgi:hypothetical protein